MISPSHPSKPDLIVIMNLKDLLATYRVPWNDMTTRAQERKEHKRTSFSEIYAFFCGQLNLFPNSLFQSIPIKTPPLPPTLTPLGYTTEIEKHLAAKERKTHYLFEIFALLGGHPKFPSPLFPQNN